MKIRVIANSNTIADQQLKNEIVENLSPIFHSRTMNINVDNDEVYASIASYVQQNYPQQDVKMNIGEHLTPPKIEQFTFYPQNMYNSLVLTIGSGRGDNFWCSIFKMFVSDQVKKQRKKKKKPK